jgi:hypothetical protein
MAGGGSSDMAGGGSSDMAGGGGGGAAKDVPDNGGDDDLDDDPAYKRRSTIGGGNNMQTTRRLGDTEYSVPPESQSVGVVQFAGPNQMTKAKLNAFRVCGAFADGEDATDHIEDLPKLASAMVPMAKSITFGDDVSMDDGPGQLAWVDAALRQIKIEVLTTEKEFETYVQDRKKPECAERLNRQEKKEMEEQRTSLENTANCVKKAVSAQRAEVAGVSKTQRVRRLKESHAVPDQRYAVVSIMSNPKDEKTIKSQWLVVFWGAFGTKQEAKAYLSDTIQHKARFHASMVVKMYEWIYPDMMNTREFQTKVRGVYRYQDQQSMWDGAFSSKGDAEAYIQRRQEELDLDALQAEIDGEVAPVATPVITISDTTLPATDGTAAAAP